MKNTVKKEKSTVNVTVAFEKEEWHAAIEKAYAKLAKAVEIKGFRKGNAPLEMAKKHINPADAWGEASDILAQSAFTQIMEEGKYDLAMRPDYKINKVSEDELEIEFMMVVRPEVTLGEYKGLEVKVEEVKVSDEEIETQLKDIQVNNALVAIKEDGVVAKGDVVKFDFEGFVDGKAFEGGKAENYELEIGSNSFIPGFEDQMIGLKKGEKKDIEVTFPEQYTKELAGKKAIFKLNIKEVSTKTLPAIDDDLALDANIEGVSTLDQLKAHLKEQIEHSKKHSAEDKAFEELVNKIADASSLELADRLVEAQVNQQYKAFQDRITQQGIPFDKYLEITKTTEEKVKEDLKGQAVKQLKTSYVLGAIADKEGITVKQEEIEAKYQEIATQYGMEVAKVKEVLKAQEEQMANEIYFGKLAAFLKENNKIA